MNACVGTGDEGAGTDGEAATHQENTERDVEIDGTHSEAKKRLLPARVAVASFIARITTRDVRSSNRRSNDERTTYAPHHRQQTNSIVVGPHPQRRAQQDAARHARDGYSSSNVTRTASHCCDGGDLLSAAGGRHLLLRREIRAVGGVTTGADAPNATRKPNQSRVVAKHAHLPWLCVFDAR